MRKPTVVGVIIPTHRFDDWLDEAVESVLSNQGVEIRLCVVANGVQEITHKAWAEDPRVTLLHFEDPLGPSGAMLPALEILQTEFIARLDADDRMTGSRLRQQAEYLTAHPETHIVGTAVERITEAGAAAGLIRMPTGCDVRRHLTLSNTVVHSSFMMRRSSLDEVGGYDPLQRQMEDYDLLLRLARLGPVAVLPNVLTQYRVHGGQISRGAKPRGEHITRIIKLRRELGKDLGISLFGIWTRNLLWRGVQFTRYYRVTKPGHEY